MNYNKLIYNNETLFDLTNDTVTPQDLLVGVTAHDKAGDQIVGEYAPPEGTIKLVEEGEFDVEHYKNVDIDINFFNNEEPPAPPVEWVRPEEWPAMVSGYTEEEECLYMMYDTSIIPDDAFQYFSVYGVSSNKANMTIQKGYVDEDGSFQVEENLTLPSSNVCAQDLTKERRFVVYKLLPPSGGHITQFMFSRPNSSGQGSTSMGADAYQNGAAAQYQPMVEAYGSLPYVTTFFSATSSGRFWGPWYLVHQDIRNCKALTSCAYMFYFCVNAKKIEFNGWDTSKVTSFSNMFAHCQVLEEVDLTNIKPSSKATTLTNMFQYCNMLQEINTEGWDITNVTNTSGMFQGCYNLRVLDTSVFSGSKTTNINGMFNNCTKLSIIDLSNFSPVITGNSLSGLFQNCFKLQKIDLSGFDTIGANNFSSMFNNCQSLREIKLSNKFRVDNGTSFASMFQSCINLTEIDMTGWQNSIYTSCANMFSQCSSLVKVDMRGFQGNNCTTYAQIFRNCYRLKEILLPDSGFVTSACTTITNMFESCYSLEEIDVTNFDISNVTTLTYLFYQCQKLKSYGNIDNWNFAKVTSMSYMFYYNNFLYELPNWSNKSFPLLTTFSYCFSNCYGLRSIQLNGISAPKLTSANNMFAYQYNLKYLEISNWNVPLLTNISSLCQYNYAMQKFIMKGWTVNKLTSASSLIQGCWQLTELDCNVSLSGITATGSMFSQLYSLQKIINFPTMPQLAFTLNQSALLSADMLEFIIRTLPTCSSAKTLTLGSYIKGKLSAAQIKLATDKKWNIA